MEQYTITSFEMKMPNGTQRVFVLNRNERRYETVDQRYYVDALPVKPFDPEVGDNQNIEFRPVFQHGIKTTLYGEKHQVFYGTFTGRSALRNRFVEIMAENKQKAMDAFIKDYGNTAEDIFTEKEYVNQISSRGLRRLEVA